MHNSRKIATNTMVIYIKTIITIVISLYTTRIVINTLGADDFGLFNVIGGLISMLSFLNAAMTVSTQRFISVNLGTRNLEQIKSVFLNSVFLHLVIGVLMLALIESIGLFLLNYKLQISTDRIETANMVFHFVVLSVFLTIISVPYDALVNAHENMTFVAIIGIIESILKFGIAIYLQFSSNDKLLTYGLYTMLSTLVLRLVKQIYVRQKYAESRINLPFTLDKTLLKSLASFAGWNLFGSFSHIARNQGLSVLLNMFYTTAINAAFGITTQVTGQITFFSSALLASINPQIMKNEGANNRDAMTKLAIQGCKVSYILLAFVALPCIFEMQHILKFWLKTVPEYAVLFCQLTLISLLLTQLTVTLDSVIQATGNIRRYMLVAGCVKLLILPISYTLLKFEISLVYIFLSMSMLEIAGGIIRIKIIRKYVRFETIYYVKQVIIPVIPATIATCAFSFILMILVDSDIRWFFAIPSSALVFLALSYRFSFDRNDRQKVGAIVEKLLTNKIGLRLKAK